MTRIIKKCSFAWLSPFAVLLVLLWSANVAAQDPGANSIVEWNKIALRTTKADELAMPAMRNMAMVQMAIHDALNGISMRYKPYYSTATGYQDASPEAAIAMAAYDVLVALYPGEQAKLDADLATFLQAVPDGAAKDWGIALGKASADAVLRRRAADRMNDNVAYTAQPGNGIWRPVPGDGIAFNNAPRGPDDAPPLGPQWARMKPIILINSDQFRPGPPPSISSGEYARDFQELLAIGGATSTKRTQAQTDLALFWRQGPDVLFNPVVQQLVIKQNFDAWQTANAFAILNVVMVDAMIACWDAKYAYNQWRPITGIRIAPAGSHPAVKADPGWAPLLFTPPYPDYPAGQPAVTYAAMNTMLVLFGPNPGPFSVVAGGKSRQYTRFDTIAEEVANARVYGGVQWRTSGLAGEKLGQDVANYILDIQDQF